MSCIIHALFQTDVHLFYIAIRIARFIGQIIIDSKSRRSCVKNPREIANRTTQADAQAEHDAQTAGIDCRAGLVHQLGSSVCNIGIFSAVRVSTTQQKKLEVYNVIGCVWCPCNQIEWRMVAVCRTKDRSLIIANILNSYLGKCNLIILFKKRYIPMKKIRIKLITMVAYFSMKSMRQMIIIQRSMVLFIST